MSRSLTQRWRLAQLARRIAGRPEPLGVGLHHECWGGVAAHVARARGMKVTDYYGLTFAEFKRAIKDNNASPIVLRNARMLLRTLRLALT